MKSIKDINMIESMGFFKNTHMHIEIKAPIKQAMSKNVIFLVPLFIDKININPHNNPPAAKDSAPRPASSLNIMKDPVICKIVHINQVYLCGVVVPLKISLMYGMKQDTEAIEATRAHMIL